MSRRAALLSGRDMFLPQAFCYIGSSIYGRQQSMRNHFISYKKAAILLLFLTLFVSGCSGRNENRADESPAEKLESVSERVIILETVPPEPDTKEAVVTEENWEHYFDGINGAAVIYDPAESIYHIYNQVLALTQRYPCSTFKIISSLIAL